MTPRSLVLPLLALLAAVALPAQTVVVKLLNLSDAPFGPVLVATHPLATLSSAPLFHPARPPTPALQLLSEGSHSALESEARSLSRRDRYVSFGMFDGPAPGETVAIELPVISYYHNVSLVTPLPPGGFAGFRGAPAPGTGGYHVRDVLAWEAADTVLVHRTRPSPIARVWTRYQKAVSESTAPGLPYLSPVQQLERERCLADSPTCIWRLEGGYGLCADCLPPLRPNAARTHCLN